ncbi:unnamed protein product, partial [Mesorhabditis spiculigera]
MEKRWRRHEDADPWIESLGYSMQGYFWTRKPGKFQELAEKLRAVGLELLEKVGREPGYEELHARTVEAFKRSIVFYSMIDDSMAQLDKMKELADSLDKQLSEHLAGGQWPVESMYFVQTIAEPLVDKLASDSRIFALTVDEMRSHYMYKFASISAAEIAPWLAQPNLDLAIAYATMGFAVAHELVHAVPFAEDYDRRPYLNRPTEECTAERTSRACMLWKEGECHSGAATMAEDRSDFIGMHIAWKAFRKELLRTGQGGEASLLSVVFDDVRREQLFFYAQAVTLCESYDKTQHQWFEDRGEWDPHSANRIRINAMFANMEAFAQAFQCEPNDRMVQRPTCPIF